MGDKTRVKDRVQTILAKHFTTSLTDDGGFTIRNGSSRLFVEIVQNPEDTESPVWVRFVVPLLWEVPKSNEVYRHVALNSDAYILGAMSAVENDKGSLNLFVTHNILGDFLDDEELFSTVAILLRAADEEDDNLQNAFGGRRYHEDA